MLGIIKSRNLLYPSCRSCQILASRCFNQEIENKYDEAQKKKILQVINENDAETLSQYDITKIRLKKYTEWVNKYGQIKSLSDLQEIDGFTDRNVKKFVDSILDESKKKVTIEKKIKGQILHPKLTETVRQNCRSILAIYVTVNSVCWSLIDRTNYEVLEWRYQGIDYPDNKKFTITDILHIAWSITNKLPKADIYVMKAEATTLRASGSDPNNPKVLAVNLQKAQMVSMIVTLINARENFQRSLNDADEENEVRVGILEQKVYFLRTTLPYRLYGTLVGSEKVSTDQTIEMLLQDIKQEPTGQQVYMRDELKSMFRAQKDLPKDMLGHCLLLALTFMDVCIYLNKESILKLIKRGE